MLCQTEQSCIYQCHRLFLFIPVSSISLFIPVSHHFFVYTSHSLILFIGYTSAPVEVSVWLGGTTLKSVYGAFCVQDAVQVE